VHLTEDDLKRISDGRRRFLEVVEREGVVYGFNTGLGRLAHIRLNEEELIRFQYDTIRSHATSVGEPLPVPYVRAAMFLRVKHLARGLSGVRPEVVSRLVHLLNEGITPKVPERGSVGASGDLSPNAHVALALIGEGWVNLRDGREVPSIVAHRMYGLEPLKLLPREALALINGYTFSLAIALLNLYRANALLSLHHRIFAALWWAIRGRKSPFIPEAVALMGDRFAQEAARKVWRYIGDLPDGERVQDPYSFRTYPQVMGTALRTLDWVQRGLVELYGGVSDNPVLLGERIVSTGNFHGQLIANLCDALASALTVLVGMADRRMHFMLSPESGLPAMLSERPGVDSGLMMLQVAVSSLFAEAKVLSTPFAYQSSPTSAGQEDWVPMSFGSALRLGKLVRILHETLAAELVVAYRALELSGQVPKPFESLYEGLKDNLPQYRRNLHLAEVWEAAIRYLTKGSYSAL